MSDETVFPVDVQSEVHKRIWSEGFEAGVQAQKACGEDPVPEIDPDTLDPDQRAFYDAGYSDGYNKGYADSAVDAVDDVAGTFPDEGDSDRETEAYNDGHDDGGRAILRAVQETLDDLYLYIDDTDKDGEAIVEDDEGA